MSINYNDLRDLVIIPTLQSINLCSDSAINLLLGTCAVESNFGTYLCQKGKGPAKGIFQMEEKTFDDIINNYLSYKLELKNKILSVLNVKSFPLFEEIIYNLRFAAIMTRLHYARVEEKLPDSHDVAALSRYWKKYYNTPLGKGEMMDFINAYNKHVINRPL